MKPKTVDEYVKSLDDSQAEIVTALRQQVMKAVPEAREAFKWAQPVYEVNGPLCYIKAFSDYVNFGFWRGAELDDPHGLLQGTGDRMRHVKLTSVKDLRKKALQDYLRAAASLNRTKGDPTKVSRR
ncbi:MAG TPA: DUF1801 domain-containing protein [Anaerolineales bacterium]|nr:DUF1801 domain-containing protein [Anaerolineales bacterium]